MRQNKQRLMITMGMAACLLTGVATANETWSVWRTAEGELEIERTDDSLLSQDSLNLSAELDDGTRLVRRSELLVDGARRAHWIETLAEIGGYGVLLPELTNGVPMFEFQTRHEFDGRPPILEDPFAFSSLAEYEFGSAGPAATDPLSAMLSMPEFGLGGSDEAEFAGLTIDGFDENLDEEIDGPVIIPSTVPAPSGLLILLAAGLRRRRRI